ncbi:MAG: threonine--tRNA ligase [Elusimicrobia bacterium GWC2_51_8]|nr:MAG: threonine--tRNA ligase [Elusimicrobia bacterium GWA2_51_34]OGR59845.1 MAG: threonine--tRNA ligase [Elusimicrobia bacterium GWC2_51_8]OGR88057.1 MAG: threonine--tRNA ligase [Elusimicrobia bacterium GWF2_52_66]HAF95775.1 threonine--tRNA ligase [Elusimicrobiota bacterium]HCE99179.1 threonine--tRNA ligase [Elusimicrobiota bacterium]
MEEKPENYVEKMRHSLSHVMAQAVAELFPGAKLGIGPAIENGFYYDFDTPHHFTPEDLPAIEKKMRHIIAQAQKFERFEMSKDEALKYFTERGEKYKLELVKDLADGTISIYKNGPFSDLCKGPHVEHTGKLKAFKLTSIAGAYWRGSEANPMLQRIYAVAFETQAEIDGYLKMQEEAAKRDHRKLGKQLEIFIFDDDVGPGLPLWLPNGAVMIEELEKLAKETESAGGYLRVKTPHICKDTMYHRSGHLPYYAESMFPAMEIDGQKYYLKPMNCPHHHKIYGSKPRSYRDLPVRLAEYGTCYRYEQSGELFGLMRVRSMQMNDAHIYCTPEQFQEEFLAVCRMYLGYFKIFGIEKYVMRFSTHAPEGLGKKYVDNPELWVSTEKMVQEALENGGLPYNKVLNEAAFYGPKIDVQIWSAIGKEFSLATNQVDFAVPGRFGLVYKDKDGAEKTPLCIHRAPLGTHERLVGFLIEHFAGHFPLWLAPEQVKILTITSNEEDYARGLSDKLKAEGFRVSLDLGADTIGSKVRLAVMGKPACTLIVGKKEKAEGTVAMRLKNGKNIYGLKLEEVLPNLKKERDTRALTGVYV